MFTIQEIIDITEANLINVIKDITPSIINVRTKHHYKGEFFIPILGVENRQKYIMNAVKSGAIGYMISSKYEKRDEVIQESMLVNPDIIILEVEDINESIYKMGTIVRNKNINIPIIAVTGSVGKTSTTEMIYSIIREEKNVLSDNGNNNTKPLLSWLVLGIEDYEIAALEVGIARKDAMEPLSKLLKPSIVVINNIGTAHIENLGSREGILEEKLKITKYMKDDKVVFLNNDDDMLKKVKLNDEFNVKRYSLNEAKNIEQIEDTISFEVDVYGKSTRFYLNAYGEHNILNAICAIRIAEYLNIKRENIQNGIKNYKSVYRRFKVTTKGEYTVIDDTYNASFDSMKSGLISANNITGAKRKIAILGDMLELGKYSKELHEQVGEIFKEIDFDMLLTQGDNMKYTCDSARKYMEGKTVISFESQEELIDYILSEMKEGDLIYLKASNKMNFNEIAKKILEKCENEEKIK